MKIPKSSALLISLSLLLVGAIAYFGYRTLEYEALLRHYQIQTLAKSHTTQVNSFILDLLDKKAIRFNSMANFAQLDTQTLNTLISRDTDIDAMFVLKKNQLIYPDESITLTQREQHWIQAITPITQDPNLLYSHYFDETSSPQAGWFMSNDANDALLIYWQVKDDNVIGFNIPYVKLLSDVINEMNFDYSPDAFTVKDNDRLIYQSGSQTLINKLQPIESLRLDYPLARWQIDYYTPKIGNLMLYLWGSLFILLVITIVGLIIYRLYREYTQTLRQASQQVSFVGQVSHELKTPLTNISLYAEMLKEEQLEQEQPATRYLDVIISESQRLSRLIQNILTFTKKPNVHLQEVTLSSLINQIHQTFLPAFNTKKINLTLQEGDKVTFVTDIDRLTQIISNFLNNAEKYASQGGQVDLSVQHDEHNAYIHVRDYGEGITARDLKAIFQPFYRVQSSITEGVSGTGIGLTIAKQLAESLNGNILVENKTPGICFTLKLPLTLSITESNK